MLHEINGRFICYTLQYFVMLETNNISSFIQSSITLAFAGLAMTLSNPFDLVRIRMQTMPEMIELGLLKKSYTGVYDCINRVLIEEGKAALFKSNGINLFRFYSSETLNFISKQWIKQSFKKVNPSNKHQLTYNFLSGVFGSWLTLTFLYPLEYSRNILARNTSSSKKTITQCIFQTIQKKGLTELYKGSTISFFGVTLFRGTYFGVFDTLKFKCQCNSEKWLLAYASSWLAILLSYPSDTIRRRIMCCSDKTQTNGKYTGFYDCCIKIYSKEGFRSFYRGGPIIFFQSLSASAILYSYDSLAAQMKGLKK